MTSRVCLCVCVCTRKCCHVHAQLQTQALKTSTVAKEEKAAELSIQHHAHPAPHARPPSSRAAWQSRGQPSQRNESHDDVSKETYYKYPSVMGHTTTISHRTGRTAPQRVCVSIKHNPAAKVCAQRGIPASTAQTRRQAPWLHCCRRPPISRLGSESSGLRETLPCTHKLSTCLPSKNWKHSMNKQTKCTARMRSGEAPPGSRHSALPPEKCYQAPRAIALSTRSIWRRSELLRAPKWLPPAP
jgi:hypothetical protein